MGLDVVSMAIARNYADKVIEGLTIVKGANCTIKSTDKTDGNSVVVFEWTGTNGTKQTSSITVSDGISITGVNDKGDGTFTLSFSDNSESTPIKTVKGNQGEDGKSAYDIAVKNGFKGTEQEWLDSLGTKIPIDNIVTVDSDHAVSSKAVKDYVDSSVKTEVVTQIESTVGDVVEQSVEEKVKENMKTLTDEEIDSLFS